MAKIIDGLCGVATVVLLAVSVMDTSGLNKSATWIGFMYLCNFAFLFGVQLWNVFVAGIVAIRTLPRHMFGILQAEVFPAYFGVCVITSFITLTSMLLKYPYGGWSDVVRNQFVAVGIIALLSLFQRLYLVPANVQIMNKLFVLEKEAGVGHEIGPVKSEELTSNDLYRRTKKEFGKYHGISSLVGLLSLVATLYHTYFLAQHLKL